MQIPITDTEKLWLRDSSPPRSACDPNGALWQMLMLAQKFERMDISGAFDTVSPRIKDLCDPHILVCMVAQSLGLNADIYKDVLAHLLKLWDGHYSAKLATPADITGFIFSAYQTICHSNAQSLGLAHRN